MIAAIKLMKKIYVISGISLALLLSGFGGGYALAGVFTIGIINTLSVNNVTVEGFKKGMADLGYVEGKTVKYIYNGVIGIDDKIFDDEIKRLMSQDIDLLFTLGNWPVIRAKKAVQGTEMPVVAAACGKLIELGVVKDLKFPGGNITGVMTANTMFKGLEWLKTIMPNAKRVYLPYNPDDEMSVLYLSGLDESASQQGLKLVLEEVFSVEEAVVAIENLPKDIDAVFRIPSQTLGPRNSELSQAAVKRGIAMVAAMPVDDEVLLTLGADNFAMGKQAARLAHQIRQGIMPADLPFETSDMSLTVNLKTAEKIGINVPDVVLLNANKIIR